MSRVHLDEDKCKGCGLCVTACPKKIIELSADKLNSRGYHPATVIDVEKCIGCAACATICPDVVIEIF